MTKTIYIKVAALLLGERATATTPFTIDAKVRVINNITYSIADIFAQDNPRFDRERFYKAAGLING